MKNIKEYVKEQKELIKNTVDKLEEKPKFCIIQVGDNEASNRYVRNKIKDCNEVGIHVTLDKELDNVDVDDMIDIVLDACAVNDAVMIQLPLPEQLKEHEGLLTNLIDIEKDVDGLTHLSKFTPCTPKGIIDYLEYSCFEFTGKNAVVIGRSNIVGRPTAKLLLDRDCSVTVIHSKTKESFKRDVLKDADLVICAAGKHGVIHPSMAPNAFIVDVGINFTEEGKLIGDVEILSDKERERVTPVPGGVGLLTRLALLKNIVNTKV